MTSLVDSVPLLGETSSSYPIDSCTNLHKNRQRRHVLKSKENTYKHKCNKVLKRKLKKYKLRQDGTEDEDVLDVSRILVSSLIIKSPNSSVDIDSEWSDFGEQRPTNYLTKMVRRRNTKLNGTLDKPVISDQVVTNKLDIEHVPLSTDVVIQDKRQTNAFKLLMDSRNKSIGCNSPGKERNIDECEDEEFLEKKNIKVKRNLLLQKMAEAKGSLKNKELEQLQEESIKHKMEKRAEKLKSMILKDKKVSKKHKDNLIADITQQNKQNQTEKINTTTEKIKDVKKKVKTMQIVDIFNSIEEPIVISPDRKQAISIEDKEFLNKLSPSLKKKESMLSYFKKLEKEPVDNLIKVKLGTKSKKKGKKKKLCLNKQILNEVLPGSNDENNVVSNGTNVVQEVNSNEEKLQENGTNERQKRKRGSKPDIKNIEPEPNVIAENRPKRSVKRPVKYIDDAGLSSSDEELHIFTPKKKKHLEIITDSNQTKTQVDKYIEPASNKSEKKADKAKVEPKKPVKLAPIFKKQPQVDPVALEAKQKFLQSGVPEKLMKIINQQKCNDVIESTFPIVVHVQQNETTNSALNKSSLDLPDIISDEETLDINHENYEFQCLLQLNQVYKTIDLDANIDRSVQALLKMIKELHPKFPVYRTYRYLRGKNKGEFKDFNYIDLDNSIEVMNGVVDVINDSPDVFNWTHKYKALTTNQIIGNFDSIKELRKWLVLWTENQLRSKNKNSAGLDSSDFYQSDTDSQDSIRSMNNLLILSGPTGCGKTSSVYAVAAELAMKVIEVNVSSKRTGKIMLQDLQEATQSHKVNRGTTASDNSQKSQEKISSDEPKKLKKRGRPKKLVEKIGKKPLLAYSDTSSTQFSQESVRTDMSLILIDDADIVFEQDDGFTSAIVQLVQCSKRPVILVTSSLMCPHLQRFLQNGKILKMYPLLPRMLGTWLDLMCLADNGVCWPGVGAKFLNYFHGDIRKSINYLQFYTSAYVTYTNSEEETASQNIDNFKANTDDESSSMSWVDHEGAEGRKCVDNNNVESNTVWNDFVDRESNLLIFKLPLEVFNVWWSVPHLLAPIGVQESRKPTQIQSSVASNDNIDKMEAVADVIDALSLADCYGDMKRDKMCNIISNPWYSSESDSVSEQENLASYVRSREVADEISHTLISGYILRAQDILNCEKKTNVHSTGMMMHRQRDKVVSRHKNLTSYLNPSAALDRKALALDYWSTCRTICRTEKTKTDVNTKRNNRFCHYLKSASVLCNSDTFDNLGESLCVNQGSDVSVTNLSDL